MQRVNRRLDLDRCRRYIGRSRTVEIASRGSFRRVHAPHGGMTSCRTLVLLTHDKYRCDHWQFGASRMSGVGVLDA